MDRHARTLPVPCKLVNDNSTSTSAQLTVARLVMCSSIYHNVRKLSAKWSVRALNS